MRTRAFTALLFIAILSVLAADFTVGCGQGYVYGKVDQKLNGSGQSQPYQIVVNGSPFSVPADFYNRVQIGDTVRFDGKAWSVVKPAETTAPTSQ